MFFPAFNEESTIKDSVERAARVAEESPYIADYEIIVVNDGSRDRTGEIIDQLARENPRVKAVHHIKNRGAGAAVRSGFQAGGIGDTSAFSYIFIA